MSLLSPVHTVAEFSATVWTGYYGDKQNLQRSLARCFIVAKLLPVSDTAPATISAIVHPTVV